MPSGVDTHRTLPGDALGNCEKCSLRFTCERGFARPLVAYLIHDDNGCSVMPYSGANEPVCRSYMHARFSDQRDACFSRNVSNDVMCIGYIHGKHVPIGSDTELIEGIGQRESGQSVICCWKLAAGSQDRSDPTLMTCGGVVTNPNTRTVPRRARTRSRFVANAFRSDSVTKLHDAGPERVQTRRCVQRRFC
jgi:hypothetical protein